MKKEKKLKKADKKCDKLKGKSKNKVIKFLKNHREIVVTIAVAMIPALGMLIRTVYEVAVNCYVKGRAYRYNLPDEYLLANYNVNLYHIIIYGVIGVIFFAWCILNVRFVLCQKVKRVKFFIGALESVGGAVIIILVTIYRTFDNLEQVLGAIKKDPGLSIQISILVWVVYFLLLLGTGYFLAYLIQDDLFEKKKNKIIKKLKKKFKNIQIDNWGKRGDVIWGITLIALAVVLFFYTNYKNGISKEIDRKDFQITHIDDKKYAIILTDGEEAVVEKCEEYKDNKILVLYTSTYMKVKCNNLLLTEKTYKDVKP